MLCQRPRASVNFPKKTASAASVLSKGLTFIHLADTELPTPEVEGGFQGREQDRLFALMEFIL